MLSWFEYAPFLLVCQVYYYQSAPLPTVLESAEIGFDSQNQNRPINLALKSTVKRPPMLEGMNLKDLKR
ncbi:MAG TPA: hypothetical protein VMU19_07860 [Bryobacteraceae bacterium]|nr:hypothetical protein [Bryobacteraceae bacterium]